MHHIIGDEEHRKPIDRRRKFCKTRPLSDESRRSRTTARSFFFAYIYILYRKHGEAWISGRV